MSMQEAISWVLPGGVRAGTALRGPAIRRGGGLVARPAEEQAAEPAPPVGLRVGLLRLPGEGEGFKELFDKSFNVTNETFFQTEIPDAFQFPLAAKLLAMSNTVDVIVAAHGDVKDEKAEVMRGYQTVALTTNVPIIPADGALDAAAMEKAAAAAVNMGEIRQQALMGTGPRSSNFFGIGANKSAPPADKKKIYF